MAHRPLLPAWSCRVTRDNCQAADSPASKHFPLASLNIFFLAFLPYLRYTDDRYERRLREHGNPCGRIRTPISPALECRSASRGFPRSKLRRASVSMVVSRPFYPFLLLNILLYSHSFCDNPRSQSQIPTTNERSRSRKKAHHDSFPFG